jgi:hypothetical protein
LTPEVLTRIYGEENWEATIGKIDEDEQAKDEDVTISQVAS